MRISAIKMYVDKTGCERMLTRAFNLDHIVELDYDEEEWPVLITASGKIITLDGDYDFYHNNDPIRWKEIVDRFSMGE